MRIRGLDVIRGIAIGLVLIRHSFPEFFGGAGVVGVTVFFALSGYLITGLLVGDIEKHDRIRFGRFYTHRFFRLVPPLMAMLAAVVVISLVWNPLDDRDRLVRTVVVGMTYTADIPGFDKGSPAIGHLWTLAIEEQFYLVWPVVLLVAARLRQINLMVWLVLAATYAAVLVTVAMAVPGVTALYKLPTSWAIVMVMGSAARIWQHRIGAWLTGPRLWVLAPVALMALTFLSVQPELKAQPITYVAYGPIIGFASIVLVFAMRDWVDLPTRLLLPLWWLGQLSYAAYLWNYPMQVYVRSTTDFRFEDRVFIMVATIVLAFISFWTVEKWAKAARSRIDRRSMAVVR